MPHGYATHPGEGAERRLFSRIYLWLSVAEAGTPRMRPFRRFPFVSYFERTLVNARYK